MVSNREHEDCDTYLPLIFRNTKNKRKNEICQIFSDAMQFVRYLGYKISDQVFLDLTTYASVTLIMAHFKHFLISRGVRLSPLGTSATNWPIVPAPVDRTMMNVEQSVE
jgi:hypothetical protein